ncbi:hypothetical protein V8C35DRAFT_9245 [Trichoderma chlorosporum]
MCALYTRLFYSLLPLIINRFSESYETTSEVEVLDLYLPTPPLFMIFLLLSSLFFYGPFETDGEQQTPGKRSIWQCRFFIIFFLTRITNATTCLSARRYGNRN